MKPCAGAVVAAILWLLAIGCSNGTNATATTTTEPPEDFPPSDPDTFSEHPDLLMTVSRTRALVAAGPGTSLDALRGLAAAYGATVVAWKPDLEVALIGTSDPGDHSAIDAAVEALNADPTIEACAHDPLLSVDEVPGSVAPFEGEGHWNYQGIIHGPAGQQPSFRNRMDLNWGMELSRVPAVWNFRDLVQRAPADPVTVMIVDIGFTTSPQVDFDAFYPSSGVVTGDHGLQMGSVIGARWGDGISIDGVVPWDEQLIGVWYAHRDNDDRTVIFDGMFQSLDGAMKRYPEVGVVSISLGYNWSRVRVDPRDSSAREGITGAIVEGIARQAAVFARLINRAQDARNVPNLVVVMSAGNDSRRYPGIPSWAGSPMCYAANRRLITNGLIVGAATVARGQLAIAPFSNGAVDLYAAGDNVGTVASNGAAIPAEGTSVATPQVAGIVALLQQIVPASPATDTIQALLSEHLFSLGGKPIVDAFGAVMKLEQIAMREEGSLDENLVIGLVDVDDGTPDGCQRLALSDDGDESVSLVLDSHGDGAVDMRDFRRLRDAYRLIYHEGKGLNGLGSTPAALHPKLDLNRDGGYTRYVDDPPPTGQVVPPGKATYRGENIWTRFDFNGDGVLHPTLTQPFKGDRASDLDVVARVWDQKLAIGEREPDREGFAARDLHALFDSGDVEVRVSRMFEARDDASEIEVHVWRASDNEPDTSESGPRVRRVLRDDPNNPNAALVFTIAVAENGDDVFVAAYFVKAGGGLVEGTPLYEPRFGDAAVVAALRPGEDRVATFTDSVPAPASGGLIDMAGHVCTVRQLDGSVWCWGQNLCGEIGVDDGCSGGGASGTPAPVEGVTGAVSVAVATGSSCAVQTDRTVVCWGMGGVVPMDTVDQCVLRGRLADYYSPSPIAIPEISDATSISISDLHGCAVTRAGTVHCWGWNSNGELGVGWGPEVLCEGFTTGLYEGMLYNSAVQVPGLGDVVQVQVGLSVSCALKADGSVWCWGYAAEFPIVSPPPITEVHLDSKEPLTDMLVLTGSPCGGLYAQGESATSVWELVPQSATSVLAVEQTFIDGVEQYDSARGWVGTDGQIYDGFGAVWSIETSAVEVGSCVYPFPSGGWCARAGDGAVWCHGENASGQMGNGTVGGFVDEPHQALGPDL